MRVPGLLIIDTPGHEVFRNLRVRGGSASDISILVVDVMRGFQPQTHESLQILISRKVPFLIAANKVDMIHGWRNQKTLSITASLKAQEEEVKRVLEERISDILYALSTYNFEAERFDRVKDFKRTVAIVPVSAVTGEGIQELLTILVGLTQRFMLKRLEVDYQGPAKGSVLEVTEQVGLGTVLRAIHTDGVLRVGYQVALAHPGGPLVTSVKALLMPAPLEEIRDPRKRLMSVEEVYPASGVIISAPDIEGVYSGSPFYAFPKEVDPAPFLEEIEKEVSAVMIETDMVGVVVKADTLGSLEAIVDYCRSKDILVRMADVGPVSKRDVVEASVVKKMDELKGVLLSFNVPILPDAEEEAERMGIPIFSGDVLYRIVDDYLGWSSEAFLRERRRKLESLVMPGKIEVLKGFIFRRSEPAIFGVRVLKGVIKPKYSLIRADGKKIGVISQIQERGESRGEAGKGMEVAISIRETVVGRDFKEGDILYVDLPANDAKQLLSEFYQDLDGDRKDLLHELVELKRRSDPLWAY
jgi:translation initiation factor 5B